MSAIAVKAASKIRLPRNDVSGLQFYRWTVLSFADYTPYGAQRWLCLCNCGNKHKVLLAKLRNGQSTSCGCSRRKNVGEVLAKGTPRKPLLGRKFGRLLCAGLAARRGSAGQFYWHCECLCGKTAEVSGENLKNGSVRSCGCLQRESRMKHGQHGTKAYRAFNSRKRRELRRRHDAGWTFKMDQLLRMSQSSCVLCGTQAALAVDHVLPLSRGFGLRPGNAVMLCLSCNSCKGNRLLSQLPAANQALLTKAAREFLVLWEKQNAF